VHVFAGSIGLSACHVSGKVNSPDRAAGARS
jgi:hypothetical protein